MCVEAFDILSLANAPGHAVPIFCFNDGGTLLKKSTSHDSGFTDMVRPDGKRETEIASRRKENEQPVARPRGNGSRVDRGLFSVANQWLNIRFVGKTFKKWIHSNEDEHRIVVPFLKDDSDQSIACQTERDFREFDEALFAARPRTRNRFEYDGYPSPGTDAFDEESYSHRAMEISPTRLVDADRSYPSLTIDSIPRSLKGGNTIKPSQKLR